MKKQTTYYTRFKSAVTGLFASAADALATPREFFKVKILRKHKHVSTEVVAKKPRVKKSTTSSPL